MDNNNQNMNENNGSSPVSKISAEELRKIKAEMNGETVSAGEERKAESLETKTEQAGKTDEPRKSSDMGGMMDFVSGLLAKRRQEKKAEQESQGDQAAENQSEVLAQAEANQQASVNQAEEDQKASDHAIDLEVIAPSNTEEKTEVQATPIVSEVKPEPKVQVSQSSNDQRGEMEFKAGALAEAEKTEAQKVVPSAKDLKCVTDDLVITPDDGTYTSNLDFTKNMSIMKTKLPLPKLPFIIAGGVALLVGLIVGIIFIVEATRPPEPVVLTSAKLNVESIDAGFVGDELDLRGVIIECKYSDGTEKLIYDVEKYITEVSSEFVDPNLTDGKTEFFVAAASQSGYVKFMCEGQTLNLVAKTYAETVTGIAEVRMEKTVFDASDTIKYGDILVFVAYDKLGNKLLSETEIMNNVRAFLGGVRLEENPTEGYLLPSAIASGENVLEFVYVLNGNEYSFEVAVTIN